ncbi:hypothetical protein BE21_04575 [Sorangium cellulosum]|uniref:Pvc16 N-terminal domain-containing protein n=1 Tax=Sorangium cellulosum TaxID=56 RepID=A0A150TFM6_SORCE|nr:hypothetical protein BE21_04575 [Sorangium cellulosum]
MADARAIHLTSRALQSVLQKELSVLSIPAGQIKIESLDLLPDPVPPPRITIFLFNVHENPHLKNQGREIRRDGDGKVEVIPPPIVLDLDYMLCAWAATTDEEHQLLGDIVRVLHDHPEIEATRLGPSFRPDEAVQISLNNPPVEEQARIWTTFGFKRFKLSLYYKVRTVPIESKRRSEEPIVLEVENRLKSL